MKALWVALAIVAVLAGCRREERALRLPPPASASLEGIALMPIGIGGAPPPVARALGHPYEVNAYQLSQGKRLYAWFNCAGCHAAGGGAAGPALTDGWWRYGPDVVSIVASIRDGRPHGMPAFADTLTTEQIWQLAGYIRSMGAIAARTAAPSRDDDLQTRPAENRAPAAAQGTPRAPW